jgi:hypothetical protein
MTYRSASQTSVDHVIAAFVLPSRKYRVRARHDVVLCCPCPRHRLLTWSRLRGADRGDYSQQLALPVFHVRGRADDGRIHCGLHVHRCENGDLALSLSNVNDSRIVVESSLIRAASENGDLPIFSFSSSFRNVTIILRSSVNSAVRGALRHLACRTCGA